MNAIYAALDIDGTTNVVDTDYTVYTGTTGYIGTVNIRICNRNASIVKVRLAIIPTGGLGSLANANYEEYDAEIPGNTPLESTGFIIPAGAVVAFRSDTSNVNCVVRGVEEA